MPTLFFKLKAQHMFAACCLNTCSMAAPNLQNLIGSTKARDIDQMVKWSRDTLRIITLAANAIIVTMMQWCLANFVLQEGCLTRVFLCVLA